MDLFVHAEAFKLGVKRSSIKLPWEQEPLRSFFNKRSRLISPPVFAPLVRESEEPISLAKECFEGKVKWSKKNRDSMAFGARSCLGESPGMLAGHSHGQLTRVFGWATDLQGITR